jgi:threonyl-tRNA synthetase
VLATAVTELFPDTKVAGGPPIDGGFYYDFARPTPFTPEDLERIEAKMREIVAANQPFEAGEMSRDEARRHWEKLGEKYKLHFLSQIPEGAKVTTYKNGPFLDLCRGPHLQSTGEIKAFKLTHVAGALLAGERAERDAPAHLRHRVRHAGRAGRTPEAHRGGAQARPPAAGARAGPVLDPRGSRSRARALAPEVGMVRHVLEEFWKDEHYKRGYQFVYTPHIASEKLYQISGHLQNYADIMYSPMLIDEQAYRAKPMNCPGHIMIYNSRKHSYRELPIRFAELGTVYRYERSGVLHGMERVRGFTQDDSHIFCTPDQLQSEVQGILDLMHHLLSTFGYSYDCYLATRPKRSTWARTRSGRSPRTRCARRWRRRACRTSRRGRRRVLRAQDRREVEGRARPRVAVPDDPGGPEPAQALRRPLHRARRTGARGDHAPPRALRLARALRGHLHRAHGRRVPGVGGADPGHDRARAREGFDYANTTLAALKAAGIRAEVDVRDEKLGAKIRDAELQKIPYMLVVGPRDAEAGTVSPRPEGRGRPRRHAARGVPGPHRPRDPREDALAVVARRRSRTADRPRLEPVDVAHQVARAHLGGEARARRQSNS